jgi:hypothetical protein
MNWDPWYPWTSPRPYWLAAIGGIGLVVIIGLMVLKPG